MRKILIACALLFLLSKMSVAQGILTGAEQTSKYIPLLKGKKVALVMNQTSIIRKKLLVDTLLKLKVKVVKLFGPEHGIRGNFGNGAKIAGGKDPITGLPVVSLYGKKYKPSKLDVKGIQTMIFDIQDVGVRFYTYISTLHYIMETCAENNISLIVLDRPNPNGFYVDGPVLDTNFRSFVGMHPIPLVHGLTIGELALMINGQGWLKNKIKCNLTVIPVANYNHNMRYVLPVKPSPNLPTMESVYLYPSLGLMEGTNFSMGRGTDKPFECFGKPGFAIGNYRFTPRAIKGVAENPPYKDKECNGFYVADFAKSYLITNRKIYIEWFELININDPQKDSVYNSFFDKLAGTSTLRKLILEGKSANEIRKSWEPDLKSYMEMRKPYLLYPFNPDIGLLP